MLFGGEGDDTLAGNGGSDALNGGAGNDVLQGGADGDNLIGGAGMDTLTGGAGGDTFVFTSVSDFGGSTRTTCDVITDFSRVQGDVIKLRQVDANTTNGSGDDPFVFIGTQPFHKIAGEMHYAYVGNTTLVSGDVDGNGVADFALVLNGKIALAASDFVL